MSSKLDQFDFEGFTMERAEKSQAEKEKIANKKKKNKQINIAMYCAICIICAVLIFGLPSFIYFNVSPVRNPEKAVEAYVKGVQQKKWSRLYDIVDLSNSFFEDENAFVKYCNENEAVFTPEIDRIADFKVEADGQNGEGFSYCVHYATENGEADILYVTAERIKDGFGRLDKYRVSVAPKCAQGYTVFAPIGTSITVDEKEIKQAGTITKENYSYGKYVIDYIPLGEHTLIAKAAGCEDIALKINVTDSNDENSSALEFKISDEAYKKLCEEADGYINTIFKGTIDGSLTAASLPFSAEFKESKWEGFEAQLSSAMLKDAENYKITEFEKTASTLQAKQNEARLSTAEKSMLSISYKFDYSYTCAIGAEGEAEEETKNESGYINFIYTFENGQWKIDNIFEQAWF